jgi:hypothetical protein
VRLLQRVEDRQEGGHLLDGGDLGQRDDRPVPPTPAEPTQEQVERAHPAAPGRALQ